MEIVYKNICSFYRVYIWRSSLSQPNVSLANLQLTHIYLQAMATAMEMEVSTLKVA